MQYRVVMPILGFENLKTVELDSIDNVFYRLTNVDDEMPSFTLIHPTAIRSDYVFDLPAGANEKLQLEKPEDALVLNIMILDTPLENSHVNFIAPLIFNTRNGTMGQVVLDSLKYPNFGVAEPLKRYLEPEKS